eukprot:138631_1
MFRSLKPVYSLSTMTSSSWKRPDFHPDKKLIAGGCDHRRTMSYVFRTEPANPTGFRPPTGRLHGVQKNVYRNTVQFGTHGIIALGHGRVTGARMELMRKQLKQCLPDSMTYWFRMVPQRAVTKKPADSRMGRGKGPISHYVSRVIKGSVCFEIAADRGSDVRAERILKRLQFLLPMPTRVISRNLNF